MGLDSLEGIRQLLTAALLLAGVAFNLIAAIGLVRMPDLYNRMQSATKSSTLGIACVASSAAMHFGTSLAIIEAGLVILFFFATAPIASHLVGRAAYGIGVPLDKRTCRDDLADAHAESAKRRRRVGLTPDPMAGPGDVQRIDTAQEAPAKRSA